MNLPHAATIAARIGYHIERVARARSVPLEQCSALVRQCEELIQLLLPYRLRDEHPPQEEAQGVIDQAAARGRLLVREIEGRSLRDDRLGQAVRNLFECLGMEAEGLEISLRAGENPDSLSRPG